jgi:tetratricopeptide (TPR) repeat protein
MKRLHYTLIMALLLGSLSGCGSSSESAADFIASGKALLAEGKAEKASLEFRNAIQIDPTKAEPFYQLALLDEKSQNWKGMYANLKAAEQLDLTHKAVSIKLGQMYLLSGQYDEANARVKKVFDADNQHAGALILRASINMRQQNYGVASADVEKVLSMDEGNIEALSVKAIIYKEQGKVKQALSVIEDALVIEPDNMSLIFMKLALYESQKDYDTVEGIYRELLMKKPDQLVLVKSYARLLKFQGKHDEAKRVLEQFSEAHPEDKEAKLLLLALIQTNDPKAAIVLLDKYIAQEPEDYDLRFAKVSLQLKQDQTEEALASIQTIVKQDPEGNNGRKAKVILANYAFRIGEIAEARERTEQVLAVAPEDENALILDSKINLLDKNIDGAITNLRVVLRNNPESAKALVLLGQAYINNGSTQLAEDNFRQVLEIEPGNVAAAIFVAQRLMASDNIERADQIITTALISVPENETLLQALAQIKLAKQDWAGTESVVSSMKEGNENSLMALYLDGRILQGQKKYQQAIEKYKAVLSADGSMYVALEQLASSYLALDQEKALTDYLTAFVAKNPASVPGYQLLAELSIKKKDWDNAVVTINSGLESEPKWQNGYLLLANIYQLQGDLELATASYERGFEVFPQSNALALHLASSYESVGDYSQAKSIYEKVLNRDPDIDVAINNLASLLTDHFPTEENLRQAVALTARFENSVRPYFIDTHAWALAQLGELDKAKVLLERVIIKASDVAIFNYHLGSVYIKLDDAVSAKKYLVMAKEQAEKQSDTNLLAQIDALLSNL